MFFQLYEDPTLENEYTTKMFLTLEPLFRQLYEIGPGEVTCRLHVLAGDLTIQVLVDGVV